MTVFSVLSPIEEVLTEILVWLHTATGLTWGWSIVVLTLMVRGVLLPLMVRQIHSMQNLQVHAPEMKAIQQKYKHDRARMNEELMKFYKENNINPASSCLPVLFQIPIFFALFFVLRDFEREIYAQYPESTLQWLVVENIASDIQSHWSGFVLLAVYVVSQLTSSWYMSASMQGAQRWVLMVLPIVFIPFILNPPGGIVFPVGLLMYWVTTNLWTTGQGLITRQMLPKAPPPEKRTSRTSPKAEPPDGGDGARRKPTSPQPTQPQVRRVKRKKKARR